MVRSAAALSALCMVTVAIAGCVQSPDFQTAKPLYEVAREDALAWQADAVLWGVGAVEARNGTQLAAGMVEEPLGKERMLVAHDDPAPGDGRAAMWNFQFHSPSSNGTYGVYVDAAGAVRYRDAHPAMGDPAVFGQLAAFDESTWLVDSDEAWQLAAGNESMAAALEAADTRVVSWLFRDDTMGEHPQWAVFAEGPTGKDEVFLFVDATNGTVQGPEEWIASIVAHLFTPAESGSDGGTLVAVARPSSRRGSFTLSQDHERMAVAISTTPATAPGQAVHLLVTAPNGTVVVDLLHDRGMGVEDTPSFALVEGVPFGEYTVDISLASGAAGVSAQYRFAYCTDGMPVSIEFEAFAVCDYLHAQDPRP